MEAQEQLDKEEGNFGVILNRLVTPFQRYELKCVKKVKMFRAILKYILTAVVFFFLSIIFGSIFYVAYASFIAVVIQNAPLARAPDVVPHSQCMVIIKWISYPLMAIAIGIYICHSSVVKKVYKAAIPILIVQSIFLPSYLVGGVDAYYPLWTLLYMAMAILGHYLSLYMDGKAGKQSEANIYS